MITPALYPSYGTVSATVYSNTTYLQMATNTWSNGSFQANAVLNWPTGTLYTGPPLTVAAPPPRPVPQAFNKYVNASDLLEEFIGFLGSEGVRKREIMGLPVELFIKWLVIRACEVDQEEPGFVLALPAPSTQPRCQGCGRWMARTTVIPLHDDRCAGRHFARAVAA